MSKIAHSTDEGMRQIDERRAREDGEAPEAKHTPGPWEYVPSNKNHGPYVSGPWGGDICDCYTMSNLSDRAVCNGGTSKPIPFQADAADANARLISAAPDLLAAIKNSDDAHWTPAMRAAIAKAEGTAP